MDFAEYKKTFYTDPTPASRFRCQRIGGVSIAVADMAAAVAFYSAVLGPPAYVEEGAHGWRIGDAWLTLLGSSDALPGASAVGFSIALESPAEAERLQQAFAAAGATITKAQDTLMYEPIRLCPVVDPFGTNILLTAPNAVPRTA